MAAARKKPKDTHCENSWQRDSSAVAGAFAPPPFAQHYEAWTPMVLLEAGFNFNYQAGSSGMRLVGGAAPVLARAAPSQPPCR